MTPLETAVCIAYVILMTLGMIFLAVSYTRLSRDIEDIYNNLDQIIDYMLNTEEQQDEDSITTFVSDN